jgi:CHAD domain-containing protein
MVRWNELLAWSDSVRDARRVDELHAMRIAAKRLRYTLEIFAPVLGPETPPLLKTIEELQERLGGIHDCDMLFPLLHDTLRKEMARERRRKRYTGQAGPPPFLAAEGLTALIARKRVEREERYAEFLRCWDALPPQRIGDDLARLIAAAEDKDRKDSPDAA